MKKILGFLFILIMFTGMSGELFSSDLRIMNKIELEVDLSDFVDISGTTLYCIEYINDEVNLCEISLEAQGRDIKKTTIPFKKYPELFIMELAVKVKDEKVYLMDYAAKEIVEFDTKTQIIKTIEIETEYMEGASNTFYKGYLHVKDQYIYIVNPFLYSRIDPIQKYDFSGNLLQETDDINTVISLLSNNNDLYYINYTTLFKIDEEYLQIEDFYSLDEDEYDYHSSFVFYNNCLVALGEKYITFYNIENQKNSKYFISDFKEYEDQEFFLFAGEDVLYLGDREKDTIYILGF